MNNMPDSNTSAEREQGIDDLLRSYLDDACERNMEIAEWRNERRDELWDMTTKDLTDVIFLNLEGSEITEKLLEAVLLVRPHMKLLDIVTTTIERVLDVEQEHEYGR